MIHTQNSGCTDRRAYDATWLAADPTSGVIVCSINPFRYGTIAGKLARMVMPARTSVVTKIHRL